MTFSPSLQHLLQLSLDEDMPDGDVTTESIGGLPQEATAVMTAKEDCRICGIPIAEQLALLVDDGLRVEACVEEGMSISVGGEILQIHGALENILLWERTALNFMQHLSGITTHVATLVKKAKGLVLLDTRKTLPGYRELEKYAVRVGGGVNHRHSLSDQVLIKDNHIDGSGVTAAGLVRRAKENAPKGCRIEVEIRTFQELADVVAEAPHIVLLDNMSGEELTRSVQYLRAHAPSILIEVSGNITAARFSELQTLDLNLAEGISPLRASLGALTYGARRVDLSLTMKR